MSCYHIEEIADRAACWDDIKYFRRVEKMEQINAFLLKLAKCSYERHFIVYWHHDAAKEAIFRITTKAGQVGLYKYCGDMRKKHEKELDEAQWRKLHRNRQYGRNAGDMTSWIKSAHFEEDPNVGTKKRVGLVKETRNWLYSKHR